MADGAIEVRSRRRHHGSPWRRKRRRLVSILVVGALLVVPPVLWRVGVSRETRELLRAQETAGKPVTLTQLNSRNELIPEEDNGAVIYRKALAVYQELQPESKAPFSGEVPSPGSVLSEDLRAELKAWLDANGTVFETMRAASAHQESRYLYPYKPMGYNDLDVFGGLSQLSTLACASAVYHANECDLDGTMAALMDMLALAHSLESEGVFSALARQWEIEGLALDTVQFAMSKVVLPVNIVPLIMGRITPELRRAQLAKMVAVEQCLFLARVREGHRKGMMRNVLIASGVGDLNLRAYLRLMACVDAWTAAPLVEQPEIERQFAKLSTGAEKNGLLFMTTNLWKPPGYWAYYRRGLDQAALAQLGLALYGFRAREGRFPDSLDALLPILSEAALTLPSNGKRIQYREVEGGVEVSSAVDAAAAGTEETAAQQVGKEPTHLRFVILMPPASGQ